MILFLGTYTYLSLNFGNDMASIKRTMKTSGIWNYFTEKPPTSDKISSCNICKCDISYRSTSNNLKKHLRRKHPFVRFDDERGHTTIVANISQKQVNCRDEEKNSD